VPRHNLTAFGKRVVLAMNNMGPLSLSLHHAATRLQSSTTFAFDILFRYARGPEPRVAAGDDRQHPGYRPSARYVQPQQRSRAVRSPRNVPDSILSRVKANGGVVMVNFYPLFISNSVRLGWKEAAKKFTCNEQMQVPPPPPAPLNSQTPPHFPSKHSPQEVGGLPRSQPVRQPTGLHWQRHNRLNCRTHRAHQEHRRRGKRRLRRRL